MEKKSWDQARAISYHGAPERVKIRPVLLTTSGDFAILSAMKNHGLDIQRVFLIALVALGGLALGGLALPAVASAQGAAIPALSTSERASSEELDPSVAAAVQAFTRDFVWLEPGRPLGYSAAGVPLYDLERVQVYRGRSSERLEGDAIYLALGDEELAQRYRSRTRAKWALRITGMSLVLASFTVPTVYVLAVSRPNPSVLLGMVFGGLAAGTTGYLLTRGGILMEPHPVGYSERYRLIEEHNRRLLEEHDLYMDELPQFEILVPGIFDLNVGIRLGPGGAGLATAGRF